eukprot:m.233043 g.233043  ORF g.233043 m.233043 type:complete len:917 (-) comp26078_c0_seq1:22-2772(-)
MNVVARLARGAWALPPHAVQAHAAVQAATLSTGTRTRRHPFLAPTQSAGREAVIPSQCYHAQVAEMPPTTVPRRVSTAKAKTPAEQQWISRADTLQEDSGLAVAKQVPVPVPVRVLGAVCTTTGVVQATAPTEKKHGLRQFTLLSGDGANQTTITVNGLTPPLYPGESVTVTGTWAESSAESSAKSSAKKRPPTLRLTKGVVLERLPDSIKCPEIFFNLDLTKQLSKPVFDKMAALAKEEKTTMIEIFEGKRDLLKKMSGYGPVRSARLAEAWSTLKAERDILVHLVGSKLDTDHALRLLREFSLDVSRRGTGTMVDVHQKLQSNPYLLAQSQLLDFGTADRIALNNGGATDSTERIVTAFLQGLREVQKNGDCGVPIATAASSAKRLLGIRLSNARVDQIMEDDRIAVATVRGELCCFDRAMHSAERSIAERCTVLASGRVPWEHVTDASSRIDAAARFRFGDDFALSASQQSALQTVLWSKFTVLTGGPGVGKTRILAVLMAALKPINVRVMLAAPTGRAAARLREATGLRAVTLHRLLGVTAEGGVKYDGENQLKCDLVVVDEASMIDVELMQMLMAAIPPTAALLLVGDVHQLPSVGPGDVLVDLMDCGLPTIVELTEVHRQRDGSELIKLAHDVKDGKLPDMAVLTNNEGRVRFIPTETAREATDVVLRLLTKEIPAELGVERPDIQVLSPTRTSGNLSVAPLNRKLQKVLNVDNAHYRVECASGELELRMDDKVMQIVNDTKKGVHNGDVGTITFLNLVRKAVDVTFRSSTDGDHRKVSYTFAELESNLVLAYACTIHKSQGSEYDAVVIALDMNHGVMLRRSLLYTAITRAKQMVYIVGSETAFKCAIMNNDQPSLTSNRPGHSAAGLDTADAPPRRWTSLGATLAERAAPSPLSPTQTAAYNVTSAMD